MISKTEDKRLKQLRYGILAIVALIHIVLIGTLRFTMKQSEQEVVVNAQVMKLVDVQEFKPPPPPPPEPEKPKPEIKKIEVAPQPTAAVTIVEVKEEVEESIQAPPAVVQEVIEYLPQHKISEIPGIPVDLINKRTVYPPMALRQRRQGIVFLELFIDSKGELRDIKVLKDPGYGFAEAAVAALKGLTFEPAKANGKAVAVKYRYPVRFTLK